MRLITAPLAGSLLAAFVYAGKSYYPEVFQPFAFLEHSLLFFAGLVAGVRLPDIDLLLPGFRHRSGITHSCLFAAIAFASGLHEVAGGLALGIALHLSSDMQPKSWTGGALIKLPFIGSIGMLSPVWLLLNIAACFSVLLNVLPEVNGMDRWMMVAVIILGGGWYFLHEEKKRLLPLLTLAFSLLLIHNLKTGHLSVEIVIEYFA